ncbi:MAG: hypothetical protein PHV06_11995 [bacterium]|nr:hypothetical protein [bacterium]
MAEYIKLKEQIPEWKDEYIPKDIEILNKIIRITGWLFLVIGTFFGLIYIFGGLILLSSDTPLDIYIKKIIILFGLFGILISIILGVLCLKSVKATVERKKWARKFGIALGIMLIPFLCPLGAIAGIKILMILFSFEGKEWYIHCDS